MGKYYFGLFLLCSLTFGFSPFYVVGENYVAYLQPGRELSVTYDIKPDSWTLDVDQCRLWITSNRDSKLVAFEKEKKKIEHSFFGRIVSDFASGQFVTATDDNLLEVRGKDGQVELNLPIKSTVDLKQVRLLIGGNHWNLFQGKSSNNQDSLWLTKTDMSGLELKKVVVEYSQSLWGKTAFAWDHESQRLWLGYTRSTPQHMYSPYVIQFSGEGEREFSHQWNERGVLFDGCLEKNGDFLISRDTPSSEFTVPLYSYLEKLTWGLNPTIQLELNTNLLVDSMSCHSDSVYFGVHSVLGGEPHQIFYWERGLKNTAEPLISVPPKILKVLVCH